MRIRRTNYLLAGLPRFAFPKSAAILCELLDGSADVLLLDTLSETARTLSKTPLGEDALVTDGMCVHGLVQVRARCTYARGQGGGRGGRQGRGPARRAPPGPRPSRRLGARA